MEWVRVRVLCPKAIWARCLIRVAVMECIVKLLLCDVISKSIPDCFVNLPTATSGSVRSGQLAFWSRVLDKMTQKGVAFVCLERSWSWKHRHILHWPSGRLVGLSAAWWGRVMGFHKKCRGVVSTMPPRFQQIALLRRDVAQDLDLSPLLWVAQRVVHVLGVVDKHVGMFGWCLGCVGATESSSS